MLHDFIVSHRELIIDRCRQRVALRAPSTHATATIDNGVPVFLNQLVQALQAPDTFNADIATSAALHGHALLLEGLSVSQVVHEYGDVCQTVTALALEANVPIDTADFRTLNRCLDDAIAGAVAMYGQESEQTSRDGQTALANEKLGFFTHELRNLVNTATIAFQVLKTGSVGIGGSTGAVLERNLTLLHELIARSTDEVRLSAGVQHSEAVDVAAFISALEGAGTLEGTARDRQLNVRPVAAGVTIEADRQVLSSVVINLVQNGFKFSPPRSTVTLSVRASAKRVMIDVEDECGGLPDADANHRSGPLMQRGADRTGMGVGLAFCRWGAKVSNGRLYARNLPGKGCIFTVDLPRVE